jgi:hypothetical protein
MPDQDRYPTDEELAKIEEWDFSSGFDKWFEFIRTCWWMPDWGWSEYPDEEDPNYPGRKHTRYEISTGGWSGNEDIIGAMRANFVCWGQTWRVHRVGGHYTFWARGR